MTDLGAELFDRVAADYDRSVPFFATFGARLVEWTAPDPGARVLDLGAGRGAVTAALVRAGCSAVAGDVSSAMLDGLREALPGVDARLLDAHRLDLPDASFDVVLSGFLVHILDAGTAFAEIGRVLRPGGVFAFSVPGPSADGGWWEAYGRVVAEFTRRIRDPEEPHEPVTWAERAERAGLRHVDQTTTEVSFPVDGPEAHWSWLMSHGNRWLHDALDPPDREAFRDRVLRGLREDHPTGGTTVIAGAEFHRVEKPGHPTRAL
ncbi:methyltransferase domain-containing protein [Saccharothrix sp. S26]|uniref:class I SAM-dependent methyltransferase n=1 Tax=Saccharothrix sp. S26 TaxID=2907215 RepID=UPI001F3A2A7C|nr:methyltransferase domain-containing protein [Saccharothrix sp. S26]MCE6996578.1 methyltransferase domain-containing protein [Saccharothrix sp. S26]